MNRRLYAYLQDLHIRKSLCKFSILRRDFILMFCRNVGSLRSSFFLNPRAVRRDGMRVGSPGVKGLFPQKDDGKERISRIDFFRI